MKRKGSLIWNILGAMLSIALAVGLVYLFYTDQQEADAQETQLQALQNEASVYEREQRELKSQLEELEENVSYSSETAALMVGFVVTDVSDLSYMETVADTYDFPPVLILDCTLEQSVLEDILDTADDAWEVMLYTPTFSETVNESVLSALSWLETIGREHTGVFLLRSDYTTDSNIQLLKDDGFAGYTSYHSSTPIAGQAEDGTVYFDYPYLTSSGTSVASRIAAMYKNKTSMLIAFDMESINSGSMKESYVTDLMDTMQSYVEQEDCVFSTVADVVTELSEINSTEAANQASYEEQMAEIQARIDELEEIINGIYAQYEG
ncbi:MAG: hypothetical protein LUE61_10530 [Clostridiales bacterium]|nr:hypothetical protein [Clostridiales bacterium]